MTSNDSIWSEADPVTPVPDGETPDALADLQGTVEAWLADHAERFDPLVWKSTGKRRHRRESFAESALIEYVATQAGDGPVCAPIRDRIVERANDRRYYELLLRQPRQFRLLSFPMLYAASVGELDPEPSAAVESVIDDGLAQSRERVPFEMLDLVFMSRIYGYEDVGLDDEAIMELSCLNFPPSVPNSPLRAAYHVTHDVMFATNLGFEHPRFPRTVAPYDVSDTLVGLTFRYLADGNHDIVLELLMAGAIQRQIPPSLVRFGLGWVTAMADDLGYVPNSDIEQGPYERALDGSLDDAETDDWDDDTHEWAEHYHANLVTAMVTRVIRDNWSALVETVPDPELDHDEHAEDLFHLGEVLYSLSEYDLQSAARQLKALAGSPVVDAYPGVVDTAVDYLRRQRNEEGTYGYWTDERHVYLARGGDADSFEADLVAPVSELCEEAIRAVDREVGD